MKINKQLAMVIPIYGDPVKVKDPLTDVEVEVENVVAYVHAVPISPAVFDKYCVIIAKTFNAIYGGGLGLVAGPRIAAKLLRKIAEESGEWDGPEGVANGLVADIRRNATVAVPGPNGWEQRPFDGAVARGDIPEEDAMEVENSIAFFTVASSMHKRSEIESIMKVVSEIWGARTLRSTSTEFVSSLRTSTAPASIGGTDRA